MLVEGRGSRGVRERGERKAGEGEGERDWGEGVERERRPLFCGQPSQLCTRLQQLKEYGSCVADLPGYRLL